MDLPAVVLSRVAANREGDRIYKFLLSKREDLPITSTVLRKAAGNRCVGAELLTRFLFQGPHSR
jgi:hypothetical protein